MKKKITILAAIAMIIMTAVAFAGCGSSEPKTLEDYLSQNEEAKQEIEKAVNLQSSDDLDVAISYEKNNIIITCTLKKTYDEDMLDSIAKAYASEEASLKTTIEGAITNIEDTTGIEDVSMDIIIKNGDGTEIWKNNYETEETSE